jgi:hypothetical protein
MRQAATVLACTALLLSGAARADDATPEAIDKLVLPTSPAACAFSGKAVHAPFTLELRPGVPYATINGVDAIDVKLPVAAKPAPLVVKLTADDIKVEGVADGAAIPLYAARPFVAGELFVPGPSVPISWTAAKAGQVDVTIALPAEVNTAITGVNGPLRATRPCQDLGVNRVTEFDPFRAVGSRRAKATHTLGGNGPIAIAAKPGSRATAQLSPPSGPQLLPTVVVIQKKKPWFRIGYEAGDFLIVGWVRDTDLQPAPVADEIGDAYGAGGLGTGSGTPESAFKCKQAVPLIAEVGVDRLIVGSIGAGVTLTTDTTVGDLLPVHLVKVVSIEPAAGAQFLVRRTDVEGCPGFAPPGAKGKRR